MSAAVPASPAPRTGVRTRVDDAVAHIELARKLNEDLQKGHLPGTPTWHKHESIDDQLHEGLAALGD